MKQRAAQPSAKEAVAPHWTDGGPLGTAPSFLTPGETCWRREPTERASVLIDAAAYFAALRSTLANARDQIFIVGWDVDSRTSLEPEPDVEDGLPLTLLPFLRALLQRQPNLHIYILVWDFSVIYTLEREWMPSWVFSHAHPRLHFLLNNDHVVGASHHQKLVVVDDRVAFVGGIDLTIRRWDSPSHSVDDATRCDPDGVCYAPMHDAQVCFDGVAARALGELARERWQGARAKNPSHRHNRPPSAWSETDSDYELWPLRVPVDFRDVPVAISRTFSSELGPGNDVHEIAALIVRVFEHAQRYVYIENQYFTSSTAARALVACLERATGPEVILVLPLIETGWLEQSSMGMLRRQTLAKLRRSDRHGRLHIYYPKLPASDHGLQIHGKVMICDDRLLKVGSANLSNRSLGLDAECDVIIEAQPDDVDCARTAHGIRRVLARLLGEHLNLPERVARARLATACSLHEVIEGARGRDRCLEPIPEQTPEPAVDLGMAFGDWFVDPERPMIGETFAESLFPTHIQIPWLRSAGACFALVLPVLIVTMVVESHATTVAQFIHSGSVLAWLWVGYVVACSSFVPLSVLLGAICAVFEPRFACLFALSGALLSAGLSHVVGHHFRSLTLRFVRGQRARVLQHSARRRAFRATLIARLVPLGNFTASNLLAGALNVPFAHFFLGNLAGLSCGVAALLLFTKRALIAVSAPSALNIGLCVAAAASMIALCLGVAHAVARPVVARRAHDQQPAQ